MYYMSTQNRGYDMRLVYAPRYVCFRQTFWLVAITRKTPRNKNVTLKLFFWHHLEVLFRDVAVEYCIQVSYMRAYNMYYYTTKTNGLNVNQTRHERTK